MVLASTATDGSDPLIRLDHGSDRLSTVKHGARLASNRLAIRVFSKWSVKESSDTSRMSLQLRDSATPDRWHHYHHYGVPPRSAGFPCLVSCVVWWRTLLFYIVQWNDFVASVGK